MARRFVCKCGFSCLGDTDAIIDHAKLVHGVDYIVYTDEKKRLVSLEEWNAWWNKNIIIEQVTLVSEGKKE